VTSPAPPPTARPKPRLRGVSHAFGAFFAAFAAIVLSGATLDPSVETALQIYGTCLVLLFGVSAIYHVPMWMPEARTRLRRVDRSMIYVFVAGTYTPILELLGDGISPHTAAIVWTAALIGIVLTLFFSHLPRYVTVGPYLVLGWGALAILPPILERFGEEPFWLILIGGLAYSVGAIIYARRSPDPAPRTFGYHEIFHLLVLLAAACHYEAIRIMVH